MTLSQVSQTFHTTAMVAEGMKQASFPQVGSFSSLEDKVTQLLPVCQRDNIVGLPANELLVAGAAGQGKYLMWVDIDSREHDQIEAWLWSGCPFPSNSFVMVPSSTLKWHMYVVTHRPLQNDECIGMWEHLVDSARGWEWARNIDRVYGPHVTEGIIYIPGASRNRPQLPQDLCRELTGTFMIPDELPKHPMSSWPERKKTLRKKLR